MMEEDDHLRASMLHEDISQDRRLIMKKIQARRRSQHLARSRANDTDALDDAASAAASDDRRNSRRGSDATGLSGQSGQSSFIDDEDYYLEDSYDEELRRSVQAAHEEDEVLLGGRIEEGGANEEENLEAMNQALTSPPVAWWAMRKQWQKRRGTMLNFVGKVGLGTSARSGAAGLNAGDDVEYAEGVDASHRSAASWLGSAAAADAGVVGHPVMLQDPASMGYDAAAYRQNPYAAGDKRKRTPTVVFVSRDVLQKRKMQQTMYIVGALCVVFLFMFLLEQRKLSHYAMVPSPISLSAYLAGEQLMTDGDGTKMKLGDLGLEEFDKVHVAEVEFGNIEVNPDDPLANEELANDPLVGNHHKHPPTDDFAHIHGTDRFELLKGVVVGWGVTPAEVFENHHSPQYKALSWMAHEDVLRYIPENDHWIKKIVQRYTLATIYYSTNGAAWTNPLFFLSNYDECNWHRKYMGYFTGVGHCEGGYITVLALWSNNLSGGLPPEVGSLTSLRTFSVFDNNLTLPPPESLAKLTGLTRLYLQRNKFKHDINYLCPNPAGDFKADCGKRGGVGCACCSACGYNAKNDKAGMIERFV